MANVTTLRPGSRRLDAELVARDLAPSRERAQALIAAGLVEVDGARAGSAAHRVGTASAVRVLGRDHPWASRGGVKLSAALDAFDVACAGRVALDAGASTGGFTDVLLARGVARVYAVDVGRGLLLSRLARDPKVVVMDETNARHLRSLPGPAPSLITLDVSFISLRLVLPAMARLSARPADVIALFKPQFELGRDAVGRGGLVRDEALTRQSLDGFLAWAREELGAEAPRPPVPAALRGSKGNQEWMAHLVLPHEGSA
ncbi:MAG: TlyA family RNA methyltransferase [Candidatus Dormibacteraeota bacterium]|nr:TlyA family RNA methyltransferase [Candidatus Dormibacteraeota bacterium]MBV9524313.1 TlyA family RNA methyltransferase [Candidatus Dormibacteraeota bacterium]